jgi:hypothetical protein
MKPNADILAALSAHLHGLEQALLDPAVRRDSARVSALLCEEFEEFGKSGRVWSRQVIIESLAGEDYQPPAMEDFKCDWIADEVALVTYKTARTDADTGTRNAALRSSLWVNESGSGNECGNWESGNWRMRFHQGTKIC